MSVQGTTIIVGNTEVPTRICSADVLNGHGLNALVVVDVANYSMAKGKRFAASTSITIPANGTISVLGMVGNSTLTMAARGMYLETAGSGGLHATIDLYEDVTCATNEGNVDTFSVNRQLNFLDNNSYFLIHNDPATVTGGVRLGFRSGHVNTDKNVFTKDFSIEAPYVMRANTKYELKVENLDDYAITIEIDWEWVDGTPIE